MKRTTLLATLFAVAALAGCSDIKGGTPTTGATQPPATETSDTGSTGSPATDLGIDRYKDKPCDILTPAQVTALGNVEAAGRQRKSALGQACVWDGKEALDDSSFDIVVAMGQDYDNQLNNSRTNTTFSEKTVDNVRTFSTHSGDASRTCLTVVDGGKAGSIGVSISVAKNKAATTKSCAETEKVAAAVIGNLKG